MNKQIKLKYLTLVILIVLLLLPRPAFAFIDAIFGFLDHLTESLEDITNPIMGKIIMFAIVYAISIASLALSTNLLETFITKQNEWLSSLESAIYAGWNFTSGLANMLLILIFLIIAFAFIFKIETFQAKKALPRLIGVALLINFSLLFVYMLVDISHIIYNTILADNTNLFSTIMKPFLGSGWAMLSSIISWLGVIIGAWAIPIAHSFAQIALTFLFPIVIFPNIVIWFFQIFCFFILSLIFLFFIFLFGARVFVLQIVAILAPLAFICLILPQTKSFWSQWFKTLLEWLLLGIFFLFFLVLGFRVADLLAPTLGNIPFNSPWLILSWGQIGKYIVYYFGILIYMAVILYFGKKFIPQGAQALIDFGKGIAGTIVTRGLKPVGIQTKRTGREIQTGLKKRAAERAETVAAKVKTGQKLGLGEKTTAWMLRRKGKGDIDVGVNLTKADAELAQRKLIAEKKRAFSNQVKDLDEEGQKAFYKKEFLKASMLPEKIRNRYRSAAITELAADADVLEDNENTKKLANEAIQVGGKATRKKVYSRNLHWAPDGDVRTEGTLQNIVATMNPADIDKLSRAAKLNERVIKEIVNTKQENLINRLGGQSKEIRDKMQEKIEATTGGENWKTKVDNLLAKNKEEDRQEAIKILNLLRNFHTSQAATNIGWKQYGTVEEINEKIKECRGTTPQEPQKKIIMPGSEEYKEEERKIRKRLER